jgi:hypothetical protein
MKMSNRTKVCAAAMAVTAVAAGAVTASLPAAVASTTACGTWCTSPYVGSQGTGEALTVSGNNVVMETASTTNTAQGWTVESENTVSNDAEFGVISDKWAMNFGSSDIYEFQYAPGGIPSDKCLADASSTEENSLAEYQPMLTVTLSQCGTTAATLWAADQNTLDSESNGSTDLVNLGYEASYTFLAPNTDGDDSLTSQYAEPAVLTVTGTCTGSGSGCSVVLAPLSEIGGTVSATQLWGNYISPAQAELKKNAKSS